ncbi:hypothetical protein PX52LOC_06992 [Limnoglobus roseus]|uniref:ParB-like N-terminal domain-containing protein n=2 Tax=Limnoglobus roseus TaxID=2598579 RepID=A0A5C1ALR9_9BACT|nr:hypothetical protein PX52LOC_06992 [Limnoglobus roseus]
MPLYKTLKFDDVEIDEELQPRAKGLDKSHVDELADEYRKEEFSVEPPTVWKIPNFDRYRLSSGHHRIAGAKKAGLTGLKFAVRTGTWTDWAIDTVTSNQGHGLKRSNADKRRCVELLLRMMPHDSDKRISELAGVSDKTVADVRLELWRRSEIPNVDRRVDSKGRLQPAAKPKAPSADPIDDPADPPATDAGPPIDPQDGTEAQLGPDDSTGESERPEASELPRPELLELMKAACYELDALKKRIESWQRLPAGKSVGVPSLIGSIERARSDMWGARPSHRCPHCEGDGRDRKAADADCSCCKGIGWVPKWAHDKAKEKVERVKAKEDVDRAKDSLEQSGGAA